MLQANAPPVEPQPSLKAAARLNVGDRLLRALYPPQSSAAQLRWFGFAMLALAAIFAWLGGPFYTRLAIDRFCSARSPSASTFCSATPDCCRSGRPHISDWPPTSRH